MMASKEAELSARIIMRLEPGCYTCDIPSDEDYARDIARVIDGHRADERAKVVAEIAAWLRKQCVAKDDAGETEESYAYGTLADAIERGDWEGKT